MSPRPGRLIVVVTLAGCGGSAPAPSPAPTPVPTPAPTTSAPVTPAPAPAGRFAFLPGAASYDVRSEATVEMTAGPEAERGRERSMVTARVTYELAPAPRSTIALAGQVESLSMDASARIGGAVPPPAEPIRFQGAIDTRGARLDIQGAAFGCVGPAGTAQAAGIAAARETLLRVPATVAVATRWRDSVVVTTCRGPVPTTVTSVSRYEVTAVDGSRVRVRRDTESTIRGTAIAGGRPVTIGGTGTGSATLELDGTRGRLVSVDGDSRTTVTVTLPDGARQFTQQVKTRVQQAR